MRIAAAVRVTACVTPRPPAWLAMAGLALTCAAAHAADESSDRPAFVHGDWALVCDNTGTCRAAGYQAEGGDSDPVSMLITRDAGPGAALRIDVQLDAERTVAGPWTLQAGLARIAGKDAATIGLSPTQVRTLLPALLRQTEATLKAEGDSWTLSLAGLSAVLLRMDDLQGRLGTPGALVRRGTRPEAEVPAARPAPTVRAVALVPARAGDAALLPRLVPLVDRSAFETCNDPASVGESSFTLTRLTVDRVLLSATCSAGAYNSATANWIATDRAPFTLRRIDADGELDAAEGLMTAVSKGRGIGDCLATASWVFDGHDFVATERGDTGLCRGFAGGAWALTRYVARVVK